MRGIRSLFSIQALTPVGRDPSWTTGAWLGKYTTVGFNADSLGRADDWQEVFCHHLVPDGAATAVFQFGASDLAPDTVVEFRKPYFGKITEP